MNKVIAEIMKKSRADGIGKDRAVIAAQEELVVGWRFTDKGAEKMVSKWLDEHEGFWA